MLSHELKQRGYALGIFEVLKNPEHASDFSPKFLTLRKSARARSVTLQKPQVSDSRQECEHRAFLRLAQSKRTDFRGLKTPRTSVLGCAQKLKVSEDSKEPLGFNPEFFRSQYQISN